VTQTTVEREQVVAFRLRRHRLHQRGDLRQAAATAPQNSPQGSAVLALRARADVDAAHVAKAVEADRTLVQLWSLRGTPCLVNSDELPLFSTGLLPDDEESWRAQLPGFLPTLDAMGRSASATMELVIAATRDALDGRALTLRELGRALAPRLPADFAPWTAPGLFCSLTAVLARAASLTGEFAIVPGEGGEVAMLRADQWLARPAADRSARAGLVRRYLSLYAPTTCADFAAWAGVSRHYASRSWALVEPELTEIRYAAGPRYALTADVPELTLAGAPRGIRLLAPYEPLLQSRDRDTLVPDAARRDEIWPGAGEPGVVLDGGVVAGLWRRRGSTLAITAAQAVDHDAVLAEARPFADLSGCLEVEISRC
jgi:hypothetical protein